ncbi:MAG: Biotin-requiring enzyme [Pseudonocardiales bacterium]|nr:Biotin-requiring enzyme [Pseudonocardiales bacterium]
MLTEIKLPQWGMGMQEGTLVTWLHAAGDVVDEDDALAEVETSKATQEVIAPVSGRLVELKVEEGDTVPVGHVLAIIEEDD